MTRYVPETVRAQIDAIMSGLGADDHTRRICTEVMYDTDLMGIDSHGISMLDYYSRAIADGHIVPDAQPEVIRDFGAAALVDGKRGFGHTAAHLAMSKAIEKAKQLGVGLGVVRDSNHYGAAGYYARMAADEGLMGLSLCSTAYALHTPHRSREPLLGTNPIGFAAPVPGENPLLVDMATTTVPLNKVKVYALKGEDLPGDWVTDDSGTVLHDAGEVHQRLDGSQDAHLGLLPLGGATFNGGGHKGSALASMVQILSAAISGADQPGNFDGYQSIGYFFLAIAPELVNPEGDAGEYTRIFRNTVRGLAPIDPDFPVQATGDRDFNTRAERLTQGVPLADALVEQLRGLSEQLGVAFALKAQDNAEV